MGEGFAVWVVGLPGSGKSNLARSVAVALGEWGFDPVHLQMDERRKVYFPEPRYTSEEREAAYRMFAEEAAALVQEGRAVVMDGSAYKAAFRDYARSLIPRFCEIHVQCSLEAAMAREAKRPQGLVMAGLYQKALERQATGKDFPGLGQVIGVDVPFEENPQAECVINNEHIPKQETRERALDFLRSWLADSRLTPQAG
ncbi:MAG: adenylyl-sulfate kinase [Thermodesulfobacteriota bacterium]